MHLFRFGSESIEAIRTLALASEAPRGEVQPGTRVYVVGDIHGQASLLRHMHEVILADAADCQAARRVVVYLGDYIDRGAHSRQVLQMLVRQPLSGFEIVALRGNHETMMLAGLSDDSAFAGWFMNGGRATAISYGIWDDREDACWFDASVMCSVRQAIPEEHLAFLRRTLIAHREGGYVFVHAGLRPGVALADQEPEDLVWIREPFLTTDGDWPFVVVHGHTPVEEPEVLEHRIDIDTGAFATGKLTCLVLEGQERRVLTVTGRPH